MDFNFSTPFPEGVISFLDTDLYKLTMQCAVLTYFPDVQVTYTLKNRTPHMKLSRTAFDWLHTQIMKLGNISLSADELRFLQTYCTYLKKPYLDFLMNLRLNPRDQISASFVPDDDDDHDNPLGTLSLTVKGSWIDTILYEIPLLALTSEAYFRFMDTNWSYDGQEDLAYAKGMRLLKAGCVVSEFGTRRRRDYHTQALVFRGLARAKKEGESVGLPGKIAGTSNVHLAMRFGIPPIGTVAHEWFMGVAAITGNYESATYVALSHWVKCFGDGVLSIALTDTFGTPAFLKAFRLPIPDLVPQKTFAQSFQGVRQDSGDPVQLVKTMRDFYAREGIHEKKTIVFSDSLNIDLCLKYQKIAEDAGFQCSFGIGTFFTNDFIDRISGEKSCPLNIVIKLSSAAGNHAIKLSDNAGKNMGNQDVLSTVKKELGYIESDWKFGDETRRWGLPASQILEEK